MWGEEGEGEGGSRSWGGTLGPPVGRYREGANLFSIFQIVLPCPRAIGLLNIFLRWFFNNY